MAGKEDRAEVRYAVVHGNGTRRRSLDNEQSARWFLRDVQADEAAHPEWEPAYIEKRTTAVERIS